jgi:hypothetical protein
VIRANCIRHAALVVVVSVVGIVSSPTLAEGATGTAATKTATTAKKATATTKNRTATTKKPTSTTRKPASGVLPSQKIKPSTKTFCAAVKRWQKVEIDFINAEDTDFAGWARRVRDEVSTAYTSAPTRAVRLATFRVGFQQYNTKLTLDRTLNSGSVQEYAAGILDLEDDAALLLERDLDVTAYFNDSVKKYCNFDMFGPIAAMFNADLDTLNADKTTTETTNVP